MTEPEPEQRAESAQGPGLAQEPDAAQEPGLAQQPDVAQEPDPAARADPLTGTVPLAQWRQLGGGGLVLAGVLQSAGAVVTAFPDVLGPSAWFFPLADLFLAIAAAFVAFGSTGSNGAVGTSVLGKLATVVFGIGWLVVFATGVFGGGSALTTYIALALVAVGGLVAGLVILSRGVATGVAGYAFIVMVVFGGLYLAESAASLLPHDWWVGLVFGLLVVATGVAYVASRQRRMLDTAGSAQP